MALINKSIWELVVLIAKTGGDVTVGSLRRVIIEHMRHD